MAGPTLDDVTNAVCPDSHPYKCLPYGSCYGPDSYCDPNSQSVESCFSHNLETLESKLAYCQDIYQNVSELLHSTCRYACMTLLPERPDSSAVCESHSDLSKWLYAAIAVIIILVCVIIWQRMPSKSWKKKVYQNLTFKCQDARADGYAPAEEAEKAGMLVKIRKSDDIVVDVLDTDVDVRETTQTVIQNQHQQSNQTQQPLENTNGSPQLQQQPSLTESIDDVSQSCPSLENDSAMSSPASLSPSDSSVSTNDDSGVSSGRDGHIDHMNLVQQTSQHQVLMNQNGDFNQQSNGERRADVNYYTNASIPDQKGELVTSLSQYRD